MDEDRFRRCSSKRARRHLRNLLVLAADYLKYLFMNRRRLLRRVARRTHAVLSSYHGKSNKCLPPYCPPRSLMEHEFSCSDSPSPAFLAAKRLQSRLKRGAAAGAAVSSCFGATVGTSYGSPPAMEEDDVVEEEDEADGWACYGLEPDVDYRAEEFITMFYEQLRAQNFPPVLQRSP